MMRSVRNALQLFMFHCKSGVQERNWNYNLRVLFWVLLLKIFAEPYPFACTRRTITLFSTLTLTLPELFTYPCMWSQHTRVTCLLRHCDSGVDLLLLYLLLCRCRCLNSIMSPTSDPPRSRVEVFRLRVSSCFFLHPSSHTPHTSQHWLY